MEMHRQNPAQSKFDGKQVLLLELARLFKCLETNEGTLSPSIYDTAQVLRFFPISDVDPVLVWLISEQKDDGGWGEISTAIMRDMPTLAAVLAIHQYDPTHESIQDGIIFLENQELYWDDASLDDMPVGAELILPRLVEEAYDAGIIDLRDRYGLLEKIQQKKLAIIEKLPVIRGTPAAFSWEAWGDIPNPDMLDEIGSVGNSPAATAKWLSSIISITPDHAIEAQKTYLMNATETTKSDINGVIPFAWPTNRFEQAFGLYPLSIVGLLDDVEIREFADFHINELVRSYSSFGIAFSDYFIPDLDDTAAAIMILLSAGYPVEKQSLDVFKSEPLFFTYPGEMNAAISAQARAVQAEEYLSGNYSKESQRALLEKSQDDVWGADKWHMSWIYVTTHCVMAITHPEFEGIVLRAKQSLIASQKADGGWGYKRKPTTMETSYALMMLFDLHKRGLICEEERAAIKKGYFWLLDKIQNNEYSKDKLWIGKELFSSQIIDRSFELSAILGWSQILV